MRVKATPPAGTYRALGVTLDRRIALEGSLCHFKSAPMPRGLQNGVAKVAENPVRWAGKSAVKCRLSSVGRAVDS